MRMAIETGNRTDSERIAAIEATMPHLATSAEVQKVARGLDNKIAALERRVLLVGLGLGINIIMSVLIYLR